MVRRRSGPGYHKRNDLVLGCFRCLLCEEAEWRRLSERGLLSEVVLHPNQSEDRAFGVLVLSVALVSPWRWLPGPPWKGCNLNPVVFLQEVKKKVYKLTEIRMGLVFRSDEVNTLDMSFYYLTISTYRATGDVIDKSMRPSLVPLVIDLVDARNSTNLLTTDMLHKRICLTLFHWISQSSGMLAVLGGRWLRNFYFWIFLFKIQFV